MLIHTFAENSVKHGLKHREKDGELNILIFCSKNEYTIRIADNGIGRKKAKDFSLESTGKGLNILDQILDLYFNLMKIRITYTIKDVVDDNNISAGTEVYIKIPILQN
jgi:sensor histidine kinase YesM